MLSTCGPQPDEGARTGEQRGCGTDGRKQEQSCYRSGLAEHGGSIRVPHWHVTTVPATSFMRSWPAGKRVGPLRQGYAKYRDARRSFRVPESGYSRLGLDWTNFFIADLQTGFGSFVAFYLAGLGWSQQTIGLALAVDNIMGVLSQAPAGALADALTRKAALAVNSGSLLSHHALRAAS
jgi:hypothetical protein